MINQNAQRDQLLNFLTRASSNSLESLPGNGSLLRTPTLAPCLSIEEIRMLEIARVEAELARKVMEARIQAAAVHAELLRQRPLCVNDLQWHTQPSLEVRRQLTEILTAPSTAIASPSLPASSFRAPSLQPPSLPARSLPAPCPSSQCTKGLELLRSASLTVSDLSSTSSQGNDDSSDVVHRTSDREAAEKMSGENQMYIDSLKEWDVLCGRGGKSNHHPGNKRYRQVVSEMKMMYKRTDVKAIKTDLSRAIVEHVCAYGGRFVKKDDSSGRYFVLSKSEARKKTSQALRETKELKWTL